MSSVEKRLRDELLRDSSVKLLATTKWSLPIQTIDIAYETVKRTKMDILMKMLLTTFRTVGYSSTEEISDLLVVEPLFIQDVIDNMIQARMIQKSSGVYVLTENGRQQLESGIYVQSPEKDESTVYYSPSHNSFLTGELQDSSNETYRYANDFRTIASFADDEWRGALEQLNIAYEDGNVQKSVHSITDATELERKYAPCVEYHLHHVGNDRLYARVWNSMTEQWDEILEAQIVEKELSKWREQYEIK